MLGQYARTAGCAGFWCALLSGCGGEGPGASRPATGLSAQAQAGKALFLDKSLDVPLVFNANVNIGEIPYTPPTFAGGNQPTLTAAEIVVVVVAFLCTLTDGFDPNNPSAYNVPAQCAPQAP